ncbi:MAG: hypothetical protein M1840_008001 [Geoglossum simile]|nr:MAG: hypothetical protein M1840_008001 [Geoglossum simile]
MPVADEQDAWDTDAIVGDIYRGILPELEPAGELRPDKELQPDIEETELDAVVIERERSEAVSLVAFLGWPLKPTGASITLGLFVIAGNVARGVAVGSLSVCWVTTTTGMPADRNCRQDAQLDLSRQKRLLPPRA